METAFKVTSDSFDDNDNWCEVEERFSGSLDTLLQPQEMINGVDKTISFAPGEGNRPLGIFISHYVLWKTKSFFQRERSACLLDRI